MKNVNAALHAVSIIAIVVLFFLVTKKTSPSASVGHGKNDTSSIIGQTLPIAYFEMDSVEHNYKYIKDVQDQLKGRQQAISNELNNTKKEYMNRIHELQTKANSMSQQEGETAQAEINQMQIDLQQRESRLTQELQEQQFKLMQDINKKIEDFLNSYNKDRKFGYILSHSPGDFIYFKDSVNNITSDIINGLNSTYKKPE